MTDVTPTPTPTPLLEVAMPALLRHARHTYGAAMRAALAARGYDDIPANGLYVIGALALGEAPLGQIIRELRVSKQAAGQLVDALVLRGYLEREVDPQDRRRLTVTLTERGQAAADTQREAREGIDGALLACMGEEKVLHAREVLAALIGIGREGE
ncbi:DNA-binding MarR family transcriptional regulator [Sphingomonas kyeonggiensis]|uniref:DNA-binding MarR family transcriptional regulator n=1 Tax=Sphingomonas kyeonggiensis TaxID=1268553 RepID=A0A7W7K3V7_9SPHN|nr:MarR family transcriptional regulator [Sphingomonas kyeonggiensis]MBB4840171.1 DNA-binding MarR family transcriptional regulator [Sphingomonas kyeonggiensis]